MTVSSIEPVNNYTGNSSNTKFDFDFLIENESELVVQHTNSLGQITILDEGVDYTIHETGNPNGSYITFPVAGSSYSVLSSEEKLSLMLSLVIKQEKEIRNSLFFNFNLLEWMFDYIVRILQIMNRQIGRCVKVNEGSSQSADELINSLNQAQINALNYAQNAQNSAQSALSYKTDTQTIYNNASTLYGTMQNLEQLAVSEITEGRNNIAIDLSTALTSINDLAVELGEHYLTKSDISLSNLTDEGNAKFQYAPFSINNGTVDANGQNNTIEVAGSTPISVDKYVVPVMSSNSQSGVTVSRSGGNGGFGDGAYKVTNSGTTLWHSAYGGGATCTFTFILTETIPQGAICTFTLTGNGPYSKGTNVTFYYTDNTSEIVWNTSYLGSNTIEEQVTANKEVNKVTVSTSGNAASSSETLCQTYLGNFTLRAKYSVSSADTLICNPCTITTADGRTKTFITDNLLDCSSEADGTYKVMKSYSDGSLNLISAFVLGKIAPALPSTNDLWLDTSEYPLTLKQYDSTEDEWIINNDLVYIGDVTVGSGVITAIVNKSFNANMGLLNKDIKIIETYKNGASEYRIWSDGWCEQFGTATAGTSGTTVNLLKSYNSTDYKVFALASHGAAYTYYVSGWELSTATQNSFKLYTNGSSNLNWYTCGYLAEGEY